MQFLADLMTSLGAVEIFITSDGSNDIEASAKLAPANCK